MNPIQHENHLKKFTSKLEALQRQQASIQGEIKQLEEQLKVHGISLDEVQDFLKEKGEEKDKMEEVLDEILESIEEKLNEFEN